MRLAALGHALARRIWFIVGCTVAGIVVALLLGFVLPPTYSASATVTINPITSSLFANGPLAQQVNTDTEREVMESSEVRTKAAEALGDGTTPGDLSQAMTVSIPGDSLALTVTTTGDSPEQAAGRANAIADGYLAFRVEEADSHIGTYLNKVDARIKELRGSDSAELAELLRAQSEALTLVINPGTVIQRATPGSATRTPGMKVYGAAGAAIGLLVGLGIVLWGRYRDQVVYSEADLVEAAMPHAFHTIERTEVAEEPDEELPAVLVDNPQLLALALRIVEQLREHDSLDQRSVADVLVVGEQGMGWFAEALQSTFERMSAPVHVKDFAGRTLSDTTVAASEADAIVTVAVADETSNEFVKSRTATYAAVKRAETPSTAFIIEFTNASRDRSDSDQAQSKSRSSSS